MNDFILLPHWIGRFGNRMHQYAYGVTYSRINKVDFMVTSDWEGSILFANPQHALFPDGGLRSRVNQLRNKQGEELREVLLKQYADDTGMTLKRIKPDSESDPYRKERQSYFNSLCAYNPAIFAAMSRNHLREVFKFSDEVKQLPIYQTLEQIQGSYNVAHLRRDDIANPNVSCAYSVISIESYYRAFRKYGFGQREILWVSDDFSGRWASQIGLEQSQIRLGWSYPLGSGYYPDVVFDWLADFLKLYFARTIFRANSSFSWWAGFLSPTARVFSPRLTERKPYGRDSVEIEVEFEEGNHPHWVSLQSSPCPNIFISD